MAFPDHFSDHAHRDEAYRPTYPDALFSYLDSLVAAHDLALIRQPGDAALRAHWQRSLMCASTPLAPRTVCPPKGRSRPKDHLADAKTRKNPRKTLGFAPNRTSAPLEVLTIVGSL